MDNWKICHLDRISYGEDTYREAKERCSLLAWLSQKATSQLSNLSCSRVPLACF